MSANQEIVNADYEKVIAQIQKLNNFLIIANGPFVPGGIIRDSLRNKTVIVLDGAANKAAKLGIKPDYILGDFDSINDDKKSGNIWGIDVSQKGAPYQGKYSTTIVPEIDESYQDYNDLEKAVMFCDELGAKNIEAICVLGGRKDHDEGNLRLLRKYYDANRRITFHSETQSLSAYSGDEVQVQFEGEIGDHCGVMAFPSGSFSSDGLEWNGDNYQLEFGMSESICNVLTKQQVNLSLSGDVLVIMPGQLPSHKHYKVLTEEQLLLERLDDIQHKLVEVTLEQLLIFLERSPQINIVSHSIEEVKDGKLPKLTKILVSVKEPSMLQPSLEKGLIANSMFASHQNKQAQTDGQEQNVGASGFKR